jgi:TRAP-type C4-dicarboxylate transport system substrate-binding protein
MGAPWEAIHTYRFHEVVNHYTEVPFPAVYFSIVMNSRSWKRLPEEIRNAIMRVGGLEGSRFWGRNFFDAVKAETLKKIKASGNSDHIYKLSEEERARWLEISGKPIWTEWVKRMESKGFKNASGILDATIKLSNESSSE